MFTYSTFLTMNSNAYVDGKVIENELEKGMRDEIKLILTKS